MDIKINNTWLTDNIEKFEPIEEEKKIIESKNNYEDFYSKINIDDIEKY